MPRPGRHPRGCPERPAALADADGDQIPDGSDACPATARGLDLDENGCPDPVVRPPAGIDGDGDGFFAGQDCNDGNRAIRPGAQEVRGNRIDENCDGRAEPFQAITSAISSRWSVRGTRVRLTLLRARNVPAGASGVISCAGEECPFKRKAVAARKRSIDFRAALGKRQRRLRAGQTIEVRVTAPRRIGKVVRFKLERNRIPRGQTLCLPAGGSRPQRRCG